MHMCISLKFKPANQSQSHDSRGSDIEAQVFLSTLACVYLANCFFPFFRSISWCIIVLEVSACPNFKKKLCRDYIWYLHCAYVIDVRIDVVLFVTRLEVLIPYYSVWFVLCAIKYKTLRMWWLQLHVSSSYSYREICMPSVVKIHNFCLSIATPTLLHFCLSRTEFIGLRRVFA